MGLGGAKGRRCRWRDTQEAKGTGCRPYRFGMGKTGEGQRWSAALVMGTWEKEQV